MDHNWIEYRDSKWRNLNMASLQVDRAFLQIFSSTKKSLWIYYHQDPCYQCPFTLLKKITGQQNLINIGVGPPISLKIFDKSQGKYALSNSTPICSIDESLGEFGVYNLTISADKTCSFIVDKNPVNIYSSLLIVCFMLMFLCLLLKGYFYALDKYIRTSDEKVEKIIDEKPKERLKSLDLFRGLMVALMTFVHFHGGMYWWGNHAPWNGLRLADIVFPSFMWIMGVCIPFSIASQLKKCTSKRRILKKIVSRSLKLFFIGVYYIYTTNPIYSKVHFVGELQRLAICYLFCATVHLYCIKYRNEARKNILHRTFTDIILMKSEFLISLCFILINLAVTLGLQKPGCPKGYLGPGGKHNYPHYVDCTAGIIKYIDEQILGVINPTWSPTTAVYGTKNFTRHGVFVNLLSIVQVFLGIQCGVILKTFPNWKSKTSRLLCWGIFLLLAGLMLCSFSVEDGFIPVNKSIWSLSFVFVTSGIAFLIYLLLFLIVDVKRVWNGYPFVACGMNTVVIFVGQGYHWTHRVFPWKLEFGKILPWELHNTHFSCLLDACWGTIVWILIALYLCKKKIFCSL